MSVFRRRPRPGLSIDVAAPLEPQVAPHARSDRLDLAVPDAATLRTLAWADPDVWRGRTVSVHIASYVPPAPGWRPKLPALGALADFTVTRDDAHHTLTMTLTRTDPAPLAAFCQTLASVAEPLPTRLAQARAAIGVETPEPLTEAPTLLAVPDPEGGDASDPTVPPWDLMVDLGHVPEPVSDSITHVHVRTPRPLVDLTVHNPLGRPPFRASRHATATVDHRTILVTSTGSSRRHAAIVLPLDRPLTRQDVTALHHGASSLDCRALIPPTDDDVPHLTARLAEIAATGTVLHAVPPPATRGLDADLATMVTSPWTPDEALVVEGELRSVRGRRRALQAHSLAARWFAPADPGAPPPLVAAPEVSVVLATKRPDNLAVIVPQLAAESYPRMELLVAIHGDAEAPGLSHLRAWAGGRPVRAARFAASATLGEILGRLSSMADGQLIAKVDDDDRYGTHHLADLVLAQAYSRADIVGLALWHRYYVARNLSTAARRRASESYTHFVPGGTLTITRQALSEVGGWRPVPRSVDRALLERVRCLGGLVYRTHGFGYVYCRYPEGHTWNPDEEATIAKAGDRWTGPAPVQLEVPDTFDPATCVVTPSARPTQVG
ncbi:MAG: hypothetical protein LBK72_09035 [Bifidobacteriaceae bacterium]|jgi:hypothetical protein|nr:hypothetical protein [Bifidobacteriaceae bacterium]